MRTLRLFAAVFLLVLCARGSALAQTFVSTSANIFNTGFDSGDLLPRWTETGLLRGGSVEYTITGTDTTTYACISGKRLVESLPPIAGDILHQFSLTASSNGTISQTVDIEEWDPVENCTRGSRIVLYKVEYNDITINDLSSGKSSPIGGGDFSLTFCNLNKNPQNCPPPS